MWSWRKNWKNTEGSVGLSSTLKTISNLLQLINLDLSLPLIHPKNEETYLSCLEERLLGTEILSRRHDSLKNEEPEALYSWKNKCWQGICCDCRDREDYLKEAYNQLSDSEVYQQVWRNSIILGIVIMKTLQKIRGNLPSYFWLKILKLSGFICCQKFKNVCMMCLGDHW